MTAAEKKQIIEQIENLKIRRDMYTTAFTVKDDFPKIKRTYKPRGNRF